MRMAMSLALPSTISTRMNRCVQVGLGAIIPVLMERGWGPTKHGYARTVMEASTAVSTILPLRLMMLWLAPARARSRFAYRMIGAQNMPVAIKGRSSTQRSVRDGKRGGKQEQPRKEQKHARTCLPLR